MRSQPFVVLIIGFIHDQSKFNWHFMHCCCWFYCRYCYSGPTCYWSHEGIKKCPKKWEKLTIFLTPPPNTLPRDVLDFFELGKNLKSDLIWEKFEIGKIINFRNPPSYRKELNPPTQGWSPTRRTQTTDSEFVNLDFDAQKCTQWTLKRAKESADSMCNVHPA